MIRLADVLTPMVGVPHCPPGGLVAYSVGGERAVAVAGARRSIGVSTPEPMTRGTALDLASVTKAVGTLSALLALTASERVDLESSVRTYVPEAPVDATLTELLQHRAGLWEWWPLYLEDRPPLETIAALEPRYAPGERHYSDLGYQLLGEVVARVGGAELPAAVRELVLEPFGLTRTGYGSPPGGRGTSVMATSVGDRIEEQMVRTSEPYPVHPAVPDAVEQFAWRRRVLSGEVNDGNAYHAFGGAAGHAGLFSTADELLDWGAGLLDSLRGAGPLPATSVARVLEDGPDAGFTTGLQAWTISEGPCTVRAIGHAGFTGMRVAILPEHDAVAVLALNRLHLSGRPPVIDAAWRSTLDTVHALLHGREGRGTA